MADMIPAQLGSPDSIQIRRAVASVHITLEKALGASKKEVVGVRPEFEEKANTKVLKVEVCTKANKLEGGIQYTYSQRFYLSYNILNTDFSIIKNRFGC